MRIKKQTISEFSCEFVSLKEKFPFFNLDLSGIIYSNLLTQITLVSFRVLSVGMKMIWMSKRLKVML